MTICAHFHLAYDGKIKIKITHKISLVSGVRVLHEAPPQTKSQFAESGKGAPMDPPVLFRHTLMPVSDWLVQFHAGEALYR